jgi:uncharacterized protein YndB with AHSA1/START domain
VTEPMIVRARVNAPVKEVHHALTDAAQLRIWLAEHAEVDLRDRYEFWGRYTPEGDAPHQRLLYADERTVRFAWLLDGEETTTEIRLEPDGDATTITVSQTHFDFAEAVSESAIRGVLQTFWALAIANLVDHLEGRELTPKVDFTSPELRAQVDIATDSQTVFDSLVDSDTVSRWFGFPIEIEPFVGGRFAMGGLENNPEPAKILDLEPGRRLSVDWGSNGVGTWELEGSEGRTRLTLVQSGFTGDRPPYGAWGGILAGVAGLRRFHEIPDWRPIWA